ncbi:11106_t:CDS:2 [Ambispora leptoticha]|uniref:11106_t:CDS:1 n=1 Tax=Ambispora leptoticha TaxID=144679 RepID=A0A9N9F7H1_9GLOM|nr:11106_t:CDS:2 [Ambispora leptoticha]
MGYDLEHDIYTGLFKAQMINRIEIRRIDIAIEGEIEKTQAERI